MKLNNTQIDVLCKKIMEELKKQDKKSRPAIDKNTPEVKKYIKLEEQLYTLRTKSNQLLTDVSKKYGVRWEGYVRNGNPVIYDCGFRDEREEKIYNELVLKTITKDLDVDKFISSMVTKYVKK